MNNDGIKKIIGDLKLLGISFLAISTIYKIAFFNETVANTILLTAGIYWLLIIPAFGITYLIEEIDFLERCTLSIPLSAALIGISSYYLGILGVPVKTSAFYAPAVFIAISAALVYFKLKKSEKK